MCGRHRRRAATWPQVGGAYKGETRYLAEERGEVRRHRSCGAFPWGLLWLIWPLALLFKGAATLAPVALTTLLATWQTAVVPLQIVAGVVLILVGLWALRRPRNQAGGTDE